jgi:mRNA-degrading endonuclease RelE of RelBE toxin-antitoxin system
MGGAYPDDVELWYVEVLPTAERQIGSLPGPERNEVVDLLMDLEEDPFPAGAERLRNYNNRYKIRFGRGERYRLIYDVYPASKRVLVDAISLRGPETYRGMDRW